MFLKDIISAGLISSIDVVKKEKKRYYKKNSLPSKYSIDSIISKYSTKNVEISNDITLSNGQFGIANCVPEITAIMRNQIEMIYDIGKSYKKDDEELCSEVLTGILLCIFGSTSLGLLSIHKRKIMVKRVSKGQLHKSISILGNNITEKLTKVMVAKWIPSTRSTALETWSKYNTKKVADITVKLLEKDIVFDDHYVYKKNEPESENLCILETKLNILTNLLKVDGVSSRVEIEHIKTLIEKAELDESKKELLLNKLKSRRETKVDYFLFKENKDEALYLLIDLISLSKVDDEFHHSEKSYINQVAESIDFCKNDLAELMD